MNDTDDLGSNPTDNPHIADLIPSVMSRRGVLGGGLAVAAGLAGSGLVGVAGAAATAPRPRNDTTGNGSGGESRRPVIGFAGIDPSRSDKIRVPPGYIAEVLIPWGTPLVDGAPEWAKDASNTAEDQAAQVGFNHDGMHYFPLARGTAGNRHGLLVLNHEYTDDSQIYTAAQGPDITPDDAGWEKVAKALAAHGVSVVEIRQNRSGSWEMVKGSHFNRRVTGTTPMAFSGPVDPDDPRLASELGNPARGTLNNCAHGFTPWGTYLAAEENWNGYFGTEDPGWTPTELEARYGVTAAGFGYNWHRADPRFDLAQNRTELHHFGWVVEIDPFDPQSTPVKRTALGRFKHEGATVVERGGRIVVYSGDDENGDYLYKFVGNAPWRRIRARGQSPLDEGTLYVATFDGDGGGTWLPLVHGTGALTEAEGWVDQTDVLLRTRQAADALGATRLHRPEWVAVDSLTQDVYVALTNGSGHVHPANSDRDPNPYGHVLRIKDGDESEQPSPFAWEVFLYAGDPEYAEVAGPNVPDNQPAFSSPDGLWVDPDGRVWVQTDISNSTQNLAGRQHDRIGNNQMLVADPETKEVRRFLTGPRGCEITGVITTPDQTTMFINVQHPGESTTYWNEINGAEPTTDNPRSISNWPDFDPDGRPRPATVVIRRIDGGVIGT